MLKVDAVFFDLDGTLFEPEHLLHEAVSDALIDCGASTHYTPKWCIHKFMGKSIDEICDLVNKEETLSITHQYFKDKIIESFTKTVNTRPQEMYLCDGAMGFLQNLKEQNIPIGLVSNGLQRNVEMILETTGLDQYFDEDKIITPCLRLDFIPKPSPVMLLELFDRCNEHNNLSIGNVFYVGNSTADMGAANKAGMTAVAYTGAAENSGFHKLALEAAGSNRSFHSFYDMKNALLKPGATRAHDQVCDL